MALGIAVNRNMERAVIEQYEVSIANLQVQTGKELDAYIGRMKSLCQQLSQNAQLKSFIHQSQPVNSARRYSLVPIKRDLLAYQNMLGVNHKFYIYINNIQQGLNPDSLYDKEQLFKTLHGDTDLTYEEWEQLLREPHMYSLRTCRNLNGAGYSVVMLFSLPAYNAPEATIVQIYNNQTFSNLLKGITFEDPSVIALVDDQNHVIAASDRAADLEALLPFDELTGREGQKLLTVDGQKQWVLYNASSISGWRYVTMLPSSTIDAITARTRRSSRLMMLFSLVIGLWLSYLLARRNYRPLQQLMARLGAGRPREKGKNEFDQLSEAFSDMDADRSRLEALWNSQTDRLQQDFLRSLFDGEIVDSAATQDVISSFGISFISAWFYVVAVSEPDGALPDAGTISDLARRACPGSACFSVPHGDVLFLLWNVTADDELLPQRLCEMAAQRLPGLRLFLSPLCIGLGEVSDGYYGASEQVNNHLLARRSAAAGDAGAPAFPEPDDLQTSLLLSGRQREQLLYYLSAGNVSMAVALFRHLCRRALVEGRPLPTRLSRLYMYSVAAAAISALGAERMEEHETEERIDALLTAIETGDTLDAMFSATENLLVFVGGLLAQGAAPEHDALEERIIACVRAHYAESDFNVSRISEYLSMNMSYLSKYFKVHTGVGLYDYINRMRINEAKRLMADPSLTVARIAQRVGFENINTFIRVFKKYETVTPSTYRSAFQTQEK